MMLQTGGDFSRLRSDSSGRESDDSGSSGRESDDSDNSTDFLSPVSLAETLPGGQSRSPSHGSDSFSHVADSSSHVSDNFSHVADSSSYVSDSFSHVADGANLGFVWMSLPGSDQLFTNVPLHHASTHAPLHHASTHAPLHHASTHAMDEASGFRHVSAYGWGMAPSPHHGGVRDRTKVSSAPPSVVQSTRL